MLYYTCPRCGANLDPWEKCDCEARDEQQAIEQAQEGGENHNQRTDQGQAGTVCRASP